MPALAGVWFAPLWPAYAESIARGDHEWVARTLVRSTAMGSVGCAIISCVVALVARPVIRVWTGTTVDPSLGLLAGFVLYSTIAVGTGAIAAYLNGSNFIKGQAVLVVISAVLNVALKIALCKYWNISGAIWGTNLVYMFVIIPALLIIVPRLMRKQTSQEG
jgi:O-antigen/teichoic acid export membrane protein